MNKNELSPSGGVLLGAAIGALLWVGIFALIRRLL
jgi:hypothetical protein